MTINDMTTFGQKLKERREQLFATKEEFVSLVTKEFNQRTYVPPVTNEQVEQ